MWGVYILECADGSYFTGRTKDLDREVSLINKGLGGVYFSKRPDRLPVKVAYKQEELHFLEAYAKSRYMKEWNRYLKDRLVKTGVWPYGGQLKEYFKKHNDP